MAKQKKSYVPCGSNVLSTAAQAQIDAVGLASPATIKSLKNDVDKALTSYKASEKSVTEAQKTFEATVASAHASMQSTETQFGISAKKSGMRGRPKGSTNTSPKKDSKVASSGKGRGRPKNGPNDISRCEATILGCMKLETEYSTPEIVGLVQADVWGKDYTVDTIKQTINHLATRKLLKRPTRGVYTLTVKGSKLSTAKNIEINKSIDFNVDGKSEGESA